MRLGEIARALGAQLEGDAGVEITGVAPIEHAGPGTLTFLADRRLARHLETTGASAVLLAYDGPATTLPALRVAHAYLGFVQAADLLHPPVRPPAGIHPTAVVAASASLGANAHVGPHAVIGEDVVIGAGAVVHANATLYARVRAGDDLTVHAGAVVREDVVLGNRVTLHAGCVIGSDGFGFVPLPDGPRKIPQLGTVVLEDDVEVGANAAIDRAALGETRIGRGCKLDNLVMVGHGCRLGPGCLLAAQTGLAGSTRLGTGVMLGGQAGISGHLSIGDGARVGAQAGVHGDIPAGAVWSGYPAMEASVWRRVTASLQRVPELLRRVRRIERAVGLARDAGDRQGPP